MSTPTVESVQQKLQGLKNSIDTITGNNTETLTDAISDTIGAVNFNSYGKIRPYDTDKIEFYGVSNDVSNELITSLDVHADVTKISGQACQDLTELKKIKLREGITEIGDKAFYGCSNLQDIEIPANVTTIGNNILGNCSSITSVTIPFIGTDRNNTASTPFGSLFGATSIDENATAVPKSLKEVTLTNCSNVTHSAFYNCDSIANIVLPASVSTIETCAFYGCSSLVDFIIPDTVTTIGDGAFSGCSSLTSIVIPSNVTTLGANAFNSCTSLKDIDLGNKITTIDVHTFAHCTGLTSISLPSTITKIESGAFQDCTGLTEVNIPNSCTNIIRGAFFDCSNLSAVTIPSSVTKLEHAVFAGCPNLISIELDKDNPNYKTIDGNIYSKDGTQFITYAAGKTDTKFIVPNTVTALQYCSFSCCKNLEKIVLQAPTKAIGNNTFERCSNLKSVILPSTIDIIGEGVFAGCTSLENIRFDGTMSDWHSIVKDDSWIGEDVGDFYVYCEDGAITKDGVEIPAIVIDADNRHLVGYTGEDNEELVISKEVVDDDTTYIVTKIDDDAFWDCNNLVSVVIPDSVRLLGDYAFQECFNLASVTIPDSVTTIGYGTFTDCNALAELSIPNSVVSIDDDAFMGCTSLTSITIPDSVKSIGNNVFSYCSSLTSIVVDENNTAYQSIDGNLYSKDGTVLVTYAHGKTDTNFVIPQSVTIIGVSALVESTNLTSVTIPDSVTTISDTSFQYCDQLVHIDIPNSVTSIGEWAFYNCTNMESVSLGNSLVSIGNCAFSNCHSLEALTLPETLTTIGKSAFNSCFLLESVYIPASITLIDDYAFRHCHVLESIVFNDTVNAWKKVRLGSGWCENIKAEVVTCDGGIICTGQHTLVVDEAVAATCTEAGLTEGSHCSRCGEVTVAQTPVQALGHNYVPVATPPTATENGYTTYTCSRCDDFYTEELAHTDTYVSATYGGRFGYSDSTEHLNIPVAYEYNGNWYKVIGISEKGFQYCHNLKSVIIPNSVTTIRENAFDCCFGLETVVIPNSVRTIGTYAFSSCDKVKLFEIPGSVTEIGYSAFAQCDGLEEIRFYNGVTALPNSAFYHCSNLKCIELPATLKSIGQGAFSVCDSLTDVYYCGSEAEWAQINIEYGNSILENENVTIHYNCIPTNRKFIVTQDNLSAIGYTGNIDEELVIDNTIDYNSAEYTVVGIGDYAFSDCENMISVVIPNSVTAIGNGAFMDCDNLTSVTLPASITSIGNEAFMGCYYLQNIIFEGTTEEWVKITKGNAWNNLYGDTFTITCTNGTLSSIIEFTVNSDNRELVGYTGDLHEELSIISSFKDEYGNEYTVTAICDNAFAECFDLESVEIPDSVIAIGVSAFYNCCNLANLVIGESVETIEMGAFDQCTKLTKVTVPDSVTYIGQGAFCYCTNLTSITIPFVGETKHETENAFFGYMFGAHSSSSNRAVVPSSLKTVIITDETHIRESAFYNCDSITRIELPYTMADIHQRAFEGCDNLRFIVFDDDIDTWNSVSDNNTLIINDNNYFILCDDGVIDKYNSRYNKIYIDQHTRDLIGYSSDTTALNINMTYLDEDDNLYFVTGIYAEAFRSCTNLQCVTIGDSVTFIDKYAFEGCTGLIDVTIPGSVISLSEDVFSNCSNLKNVTIEDGVQIIGRGAFHQCDAIENIKLPDSVNTINIYAFFSCNNLTTVELGRGVQTIGQQAFAYCSKLERIIFNGTTHEWLKISKVSDWSDGTGEFLIQCTDGLLDKDGESTHELTIDQTNRNLVGYTGQDGEELMIPKVVVDNGVTYEVTRIGEEAFFECSNLVSITLPDSITDIGTQAFCGCNNITAITIPDSVISIGESAFNSCEQLKYLVIGKGVTAIGQEAFAYCPNLSGISVDDENTTYYSASDDIIDRSTNTLIVGCNYTNLSTNITSIGDYAFCGSRRTSKYIPDTITSIGEFAFCDCVGLHSVNFGKGITTISKGAFGWCYDLTQVTIPTNVKSIDENAFVNCTNLTSIVFEGSTEQWKAINKHSEWISHTNYYVYCVDSALTPDGTAFTPQLAKPKVKIESSLKDISISPDKVWKITTTSSSVNLKGMYLRSDSIKSFDTGVQWGQINVPANVFYIKCEPTTRLEYERNNLYKEYITIKIGTTLESMYSDKLVNIEHHFIASISASKTPDPGKISTLTITEAENAVLITDN